MHSDRTSMTLRDPLVPRDTASDTNSYEREHDSLEDVSQRKRIKIENQYD